VAVLALAVRAVLLTALGSVPWYPSGSAPRQAISERKAEAGRTRLPSRSSSLLTSPARWQHRCATWRRAAPICLPRSHPTSLTPALGHSPSVRLNLFRSRSSSPTRLVSVNFRAPDIELNRLIQNLCFSRAATPNNCVGVAGLRARANRVIQTAAAHHFSRPSFQLESRVLNLIEA
jgi:hypothetical protein